MHIQNHQLSKLTYQACLISSSWYGVSFVDAKFDRSCIILSIVLCVLSCYKWPRYIESIVSTPIAWEDLRLLWKIIWWVNTTLYNIKARIVMIVSHNHVHEMWIKWFLLILMCILPFHWYSVLVSQPFHEFIETEWRIYESLNKASIYLDSSLSPVQYQGNIWTNWIVV